MYLKKRKFSWNFQWFLPAQLWELWETDFSKFVTVNNLYENRDL
jgi:hypothetical protein